MKKAHSMITVATLFFLTFFAFSVFTPQMLVAAEKYEWKLQSVWGPTAPVNTGLKMFAENIDKATNGRIKIKVYTANELVKIRATFGAVQSGAVEMGCSTGAYVARTIPEAIFEGDLSFSVTTPEQFEEILYEYGIADQLQQAYKEKGLRWICLHYGGLAGLMTNKPVHTVDDLKKLKIRTLGMMPRVLNKLGVTTVSSIPGAEQYVALQRGTVDGTVYSLPALDTYKLREVTKYVAVLPSAMATNVFMNLKTWESLSPELQEAFKKASTEHVPWVDNAYFELGAIALGRFAISDYGEIIKLPESEKKKFRKAAFDAWDEYGKKKGPRVIKMVDIMKKYMVDKGFVD